MKIKGLKGEFAFHALIKGTGRNGYIGTMWDGWQISESKFFIEDEIDTLRNELNTQIKWPAEVWEDGSIYIPTINELEEGNV